jgi:hypothetical protein
LEWPVATAIAEFFSTLISIKGSPGASKFLFQVLFKEMVLGKIGLGDPDGRVHVFRKGRGMCDGVYGTGDIGGIYTLMGELYKIWHFYEVDSNLREQFPDIFGIVRCIRGRVSSDNSLVAYPDRLDFLSGVHPSTAKILLNMGLEVKTEESLLTTDLSRALTMSWHLADISTSSMPIIIAWKPTEEIVKSFCYPEKLLNYDTLNGMSRRYLGEILTSLYILSYWNIETRDFLTIAWQILWTDQEEEEFMITHVRDFEMKTGLTSEEVGNLNTAWDTPYPPELVVRLWIGKDNPFLIPRFAKAASTPQQSAQALRALNANEIGIIEPPETSSIEIEDVDFYDGDTLV